MTADDHGLARAVEGALREGDVHEACVQLLAMAEAVDPGQRNEALQLAGRTASLTREFGRGLVSREDFNVDQNRLRQAILQLLQDLLSRPQSGAEPHGPDGPRTVFLSYARDDQVVATPLVDGLRAAGIDVWLDVTHGRAGDSLPTLISEALRDCRHAVVLLTPRYLDRRWTRLELDVLVALELGDGRERIIPVRHGLTPDEVVERFTLLAHRLSLSLDDDGLDHVVTAIRRALGKASG
jgi:hypothetical protein